MSAVLRSLPLSLSLSLFLSLQLLLLVCQFPVSLSYLDFGYDSRHKYKPNKWDDLDIDPEEDHDYAEFVGKEPVVDLKISKNKCGSDRRQSPINLIANDVCGSTHEILTRKIRPTDCVMDDMQFQITPHILRARFPSIDNQNNGGCRRPEIDVPNGWPSRWTNIWVEFTVRSEHLIDGRRYDGELTIAHIGQNSQMREMSNVSILLDASAYTDHPIIQAFIDNFKKRTAEVKKNCEKGQPEKNYQDPNFGQGNVTALQQQMRQRKLQEKYKRKQLEEDMEDFPQHYANTTENDKMTPLFMEEELKAILSGRQVRRLKDKYDGKGIRAKMFPYDLFPTIFWYRYKGSLTMPPCTEMVLWHVLDKPLKISQIQLKELADLLYSYQDEKTCELNTMATRKGDVFRPLQKQNMEEQNVTHCVEGTWTDWKYDEGKYR